MRTYLISCVFVNLFIGSLVTYSGDSDKDRLSDEQELELGTDQNNPDTDGDGLEDGFEVVSNYNGNPSRKPTDYSNPWITDPLNSDTDGDGLSDGWEMGEGRYTYISETFTWHESLIDSIKIKHGH